MNNLSKHKEKRLFLENGSINLTEDGYYQVQTKKKARLFWLVPVREKFRAQVDAETGEIIKIRNPWWGFLARDNKE
jgi:trehalose-6-phosphatase